MKTDEAARPRATMVREAARAVAARAAARVVATRVVVATDGAVPSAVSKTIAASSSVVRRVATLWLSRLDQVRWDQTSKGTFILVIFVLNAHDGYIM